MENTLKWASPQSVSGSFMMAILAHVLIFGGAILIFSVGYRSAVEQPIAAEEVGYETLAEPPLPAEMARPLARTEEVAPVLKPDAQPDLAAKELQDSQSSVAGTQKSSQPAASTGAQGTGDALATPFYKIRPKYPRAALVSGVEGWILLKIDVNGDGAVENVRVIGGEQRSMFQDEARRAVEKWKYKPFLNASGQPTKKTDHEVRVDFRLKDAA